MDHSSKGNKGIRRIVLCDLILTPEGVTLGKSGSHIYLSLNSVQTVHTDHVFWTECDLHLNLHCNGGGALWEVIRSRLCHGGRILVMELELFYEEENRSGSLICMYTHQ